MLSELSFLIWPLKFDIPKLDLQEIDFSMKRLGHSTQNDLGRMRLIDNYVNEHGDVSMGTIEQELGISFSKQYKLSLAYRDQFLLTRLKNGIWSSRITVKDEILPVPNISQDHLTGA